jgi:hypothetical protein
MLHAQCRHFFFWVGGGDLCQKHRAIIAGGTWKTRNTRCTNPDQEFKIAKSRLVWGPRPENPTIIGSAGPLREFKVSLGGPYFSPLIRLSSPS